MVPSMLLAVMAGRWVGQGGRGILAQGAGHKGGSGPRGWAQGGFRRDWAQGSWALLQNAQCHSLEVSVVSATLYHACTTPSGP